MTNYGRIENSARRGSLSAYVKIRGVHIVTVRHDAEVLAALDKRVCMNYTPLLGGGKPKRSTSDDSKTALRDPAAVRAPHPDIWRLWFRRCLRRVANAREF